MFATILPTTNIVWLSVILLIVGLVAIIKGGDWFVDAAVWMAEVFHMPKFLIGATIVSIATTLPEMIVSIIAVINGQFATSVGNAVGSVTANTGLILAIGVLFMQSKVDKKDFFFQGNIILLACIVLLLLGGSSEYFSLAGTIVLALMFICYMVATIKQAYNKAKENPEVEEEIVDKSKKAIVKNILLFVVGITCIVLGSDLLVENAVFLATTIGISEGIIAITIVAVGTSLPELITTITAVVKKQGELGVGNIVGANIIDMLLILPICSIICGGKLEIAAQCAKLDMPALLVVSAIAVIPPMITGKFKKWQGALLLGAYVAYLALAFIFFIK